MWWKSYHPLGEIEYLTISLSELCQQMCKQFCMTLKINFYQLAIVIKRKRPVWKTFGIE